MSRRDRGLVYSSEGGRLCPDCGEPSAACRCTAGAPGRQSGEDKQRGDGNARSNGSARGDGTVRVGRETQGRKGKGVTVITGVPLGGDELAALAKDLKARCGAGGTVRDGMIEIQGDHRDRLVAELQARGYRAKKSGG